MKQAINIDAPPSLRDQQDALALACFRALASDCTAACPLESVRDWNLAVETLEIHGLLPVIGSAAASGSAAAGGVPDAIRQHVLKHKLRLSLYHANALDALSGISREMQAAGIPYAVLKGTYLYELLYRDRFPRAYGDIDLLVPRERIAEATAALQKAGYDDESAQAGHGGMPRWHFHAAFTSRKPGGLPVELHRSLVDRCNLYRVPEDELFGRLVEFKTRQTCFTVLATEDQLIYLCLHAAKHGILNSTGLRSGYAAEWFCGPAVGNRLLWFLDIELFLRKERDNLDWCVVAERAREWNVSDDVINGLRVLALLQPGSLADDALERLGNQPKAAFTRTASAPDTGSQSMPRQRRTILHHVLGSKAGTRFLERSMQTNSLLLVRPIRLFLVGRMLVPSPAQLLRYHRKTNRLWLPWLYLLHPFHMLRKMLVP